MRPAPVGHDHRAQPLGAVVEAEAAGEEAERRRDLDDVARGDAGRHVAARHHLAPLLDVGGRVRIEDRVAGGAARHVHAAIALGRAAGQRERIGIAQLVLGEERQAAPVVQARCRPARTPPSRRAQAGCARTRASVCRMRSSCRRASASGSSVSSSGWNMVTGRPRDRGGSKTPRDTRPGEGDAMSAPQHIVRGGCTQPGLGRIRLTPAPESPPPRPESPTSVSESPGPPRAPGRLAGVRRWLSCRGRFALTRLRQRPVD